MNYTLNDKEMFADIADNIAIIINSKTGIYYGLNSLGSLVFENLLDGSSKDDILAYFKSLSDCPLDIEKRLNDFINEMLSYNLIVPSDSATHPVNIDLAVINEAKFNFEVKAYDDAKELLLADPIHEVKEDIGWTPEKTSIGYSKEEVKIREQKLEQNR